MLSSVEQAFVGRDEIRAPLACVAGVLRGREREEGRFLSFLPRALSRPNSPFPFLFNACHTG